MTEEIFFDLFPYSFHDGDLKDPLWEGADLTLSICRCPPGPVDEADENSRFLIVKFENTRDFWIWNNHLSYKEGMTDEDFWIPATPDDIAPYLEDGNYVNDGYFKEGRVVFEECIRFACDGAKILLARPLRDDD